MAESEEHPRQILHNFISPDLCKELEFIHKSSCTIGYRPNVFSTTLSHLIATNSPHFILPLIPIRESLKEKVEEYFGCEFELFVEFTGIISWCKGASIGWHSDDNRSYLKQRDFAAVCYLNSFGVDFGGGTFHFQDGEPKTFIPVAGDVLLYTADSRNVHSVEEVTHGERLTLTLWFTRDESHNEDSKLISYLTQSSLMCLDRKFGTYLPFPASNNMYCYPPEQASTFQLGFDVRCARLHVLGYDLYSSADVYFSSELDSCMSEVMTQPFQLARGKDLFDKEFSNILHLLQVVQFYHWKSPELQSSESKKKTDKVVPLSQCQQEKLRDLKHMVLKDPFLAETIVGPQSNGEAIKSVFDWATFSAAADLWEAYSSQLRLPEMLIKMKLRISITVKIERMLQHW